MQLRGPGAVDSRYAHQAREEHVYSTWAAPEPAKIRAPRATTAHRPATPEAFMATSTSAGTSYANTNARRRPRASAQPRASRPHLGGPRVWRALRVRGITKSRLSPCLRRNAERVLPYRRPCRLLRAVPVRPEVEFSQENSCASESAAAVYAECLRRRAPTSAPTAPRVATAYDHGARRNR
jgi:hypothetical protein